MISLFHRLYSLAPNFPLIWLVSAFVGSHIFGNSANHTVWIEESGAVKATGSNEYGQLGLEVLRESHHPIPSKFGVVQVASGQKHSVYLMSDGTVWAAGLNSDGQLGDGTTTQRNNPVEVTNADGTRLNGVVGISAGSFHTVYLKSDGTVWAAGYNDHRQLGDGTTTQRNNPVQVKNADGTGLNGVIGISAGSNHTVFLKGDGTVLATGSNTYGQLGDGTTTQRNNPVQVTNADGTGLNGVVGISAAGYKTIYLKSDGTVWAAGYNGYGQLGDGTTTQRNNPVQVVNADGTGLSGVVGISAGFNHTVYLKGDGTVWAVGSNTYGKLEDGTTTDSSNPVQVTSADGTGLSGVVGILAARNHTVYLKSDGTVWAAGRNTYGQLGDGTTTDSSNPVQVTNADGTGLSGVVGISAGSSHTVYLMSDGTVWAVGSNGNGQLGEGTTTDSTTPVQVVKAPGGGLSHIIQTASGEFHTVYLKSDGTVWAAGSNSNGQLGDGTTINRGNPVQVKKADGTEFKDVEKISAGNSHTIYLKSDGTVWAAGKNSTGQLGDGTTTDSSYPIQLKNADGSNFTGVVGLSAGGDHTLFVKSDGTVWSTGLNHLGQLGVGSHSNSSYAVQVKSVDDIALSGMVDVSGGAYHSVFLKNDGTVWAAGANSSGQLGDGSTSFRKNPIQVINADSTPLSGVVQISTGVSHTIYTKSDGTVWATGDNGFGQLGDGTTSDSSYPVQVKNVDNAPLTGVKRVSALNYHTLYLKGDGTVWASGYNDFGQLGDGSTTNSSYPLQVKNSDDSPLVEIVGISAGKLNSVYLKSDGTVWAAGSNSQGQLGNISVSQDSNPVQVSAPTEPSDPFGKTYLKQISAGSSHTVYLKSDGTVWAGL